MQSLEVLIVAVLLLIAGVAFCFGGYKWFMILLPMLAFVGGFVIGSQAVSGAYGHSILAALVILVAGLIVGLIFAVLVYLFFNLAIILLGASLGYALSSAATVYLGIENGMITNILGLIIGSIAAILALRFNLPKYFIIAFTALIGSDQLISGALILLGFTPVSDPPTGMLGLYITRYPGLIAVWLILAVAGAAVQLHRSKLYELDLQAGAKSTRG